MVWGSSRIDERLANGTNQIMGVCLKTGYKRNSYQITLERQLLLHNITNIVIFSYGKRCSRSTKGSTHTKRTNNKRRGEYTSGTNEIRCFAKALCVFLSNNNDWQHLKRCSMIFLTDSSILLWNDNFRNVHHRCRLCFKRMLLLWRSERYEQSEFNEWCTHRSISWIWK